MAKTLRFSADQRIEDFTTQLIAVVDKTPASMHEQLCVLIPLACSAAYAAGETADSFIESVRTSFAAYVAEIEEGNHE